MNSKPSTLRRHNVRALPATRCLCIRKARHARRRVCL